jgi:hypothetical protein
LGSSSISRINSRRRKRRRRRGGVKNPFIIVFQAGQGRLSSVRRRGGRSNDARGCGCGCGWTDQNSIGTTVTRWGGGFSGALDMYIHTYLITYR